MTISENQGAKLAKESIEAWNDHDFNQILSHYADKVEFTSPFVAKLEGEGTGTIYGKEALGKYFTKGLEKFPTLHFELVSVTTGISSVALYYRSVNELMACETMFLDQHGKVDRVVCHYSSSVSDSE